jgi:mycothiol system anti-sigma-R factor
MNCEKLLQVAYAYIDGDSTEINITEVEAHLDLCRECFSRVDFEKLLRKCMQAKTSHTCPDALKERIKNILNQF